MEIKCKACKKINGCDVTRCTYCFSFLDTHCHNKKNECIPFIKDCEDHAKICDEYDHHDECACQNP